MPQISIIMPVYNGAAFLDRALGSVCGQTYPDWELLAVDDGSTDDSHARLRAYQGLDPRLQALRLPSNQGPSAARNYALRQARGRMIVYLDCDDEYYADYLAHVHARQEEADVLVFAYDLVEERPGAVDYGQVHTWNPAEVQERLMERHIACPLAVAHRRELLDRVGLFNETWYLVEEDSDLWRPVFLALVRRKSKSS